MGGRKRKWRREREERSETDIVIVRGRRPPPAAAAFGEYERGKKWGRGLAPLSCFTSFLSIFVHLFAFRLRYWRGSLFERVPSRQERDIPGSFGGFTLFKEEEKDSVAF